MISRFLTLDSQLAEWKSLQPVSKESSGRLWKKLRLDWNYHSNHIEGNTLTYGETEILLMHDQATGDHVLRNYVEMKAHDLAIEHLLAISRQASPLTEADIRNFNQILLKEPFWKSAITPDGQPSRIQIQPGEYKTQPNNVRTASGEIFQFADPSEVPARMHSLTTWLRDSLENGSHHPIEIASKLHRDFVLIHPFGDGNGRTARILVNYVLIAKGYLPLIVPTEQKDRYLAALRKADTGDLDSFIEYLTACAENTMNWGIRAAKGENIDDPDDLLKEIELFKRRQNSESKEVIARSNHALIELYDLHLRSLLSEFLTLISVFDELFAETSIQAPFGISPRDQIIDRMDNFVDTGGLANYPEFYLNYNLRGFKGNAPTPFNVISQIVISFGEFGYSIRVAATNGENRLYGQPIPETERKAILKPALEYLFIQIKKNSEEN